MSFFDYFRSNKKPTSAELAKERLQIIVAHERGKRTNPDYLPKMQLLNVEQIQKNGHGNIWNICVINYELWELALIGIEK